MYYEEANAVPINTISRDYQAGEGGLKNSLFEYIRASIKVWSSYICKAGEF